LLLYLQSEDRRKRNTQTSGEKKRTVPNGKLTNKKVKKTDEDKKKSDKDSNAIAVS